MSDGLAIGNQDTRFLEIAQKLSVEYVGELSRWNGSHFQWLIGLAPRRKGAIGEKLVDLWLVQNGYVVKRATHSGCDRVVNGHNFEVKMSTLWGSGIYTFQQLRNQDYAQVFCLGLSPEVVHAWVIPKDVVWHHSLSQHGGKAGRDTRWLQFAAHEPPSWMAAYGGSLDDAARVLRDLNLQ